MKHPSNRRLIRVFLAYLDDSGTNGLKQNATAQERTKHSQDYPFQVVTAVIIQDQAFSTLEYGHAVAVTQLLSEEQRDKFEEFHASELLVGSGAFHGIAQDARFEAVGALLVALGATNATVVYGAVNRENLQKSRYWTADSLAMAFELCLNGVRKFTEQQSTHFEHICMLIADGGASKDVNDKLRRAFRRSRPRIYSLGDDRVPVGDPFHDEMYFGVSSDSIGLQMADLCGLLINKHLKGDTAYEGVYKEMEGSIAFHEVEGA